MAVDARNSFWIFSSKEKEIWTKKIHHVYWLTIGYLWAKNEGSFFSKHVPHFSDFTRSPGKFALKFLWKGVNKTTCLSVINEYEIGGLKMIDLDPIITSLRLTWLKRIFGVNDGAWKDYLRHQLKRCRGLFLFHCNYNVKDHPIPLQFYAEMLQWWPEFVWYRDRVW